MWRSCVAGSGRSRTTTTPSVKAPIRKLNGHRLSWSTQARTTVASLHLTARGEESGIDVDVHLYGHLKVREGKVAYLFEHQDRAEALKAVGLEE